MKLHNDIIINSIHHGKRILMDARYIPDHKKKRVILFIHGFKGFKDWGHFNLLADKMALHHFVFVKINLSHNGTDPEHPHDFTDLEAFSENNFSIELDDIGSAIDYLFSKDCAISTSEMDLDQLFLMGHSRGGGLVLLKAGEDHRVKAVATWAAVSDFNRWAAEVMEEWKQKGVTYIYNSRTLQNMPLKYQIIEDLQRHSRRLDILGTVRQLNIPMLIAHGTADETVSVEDAKKLHEANPQSELYLLEAGNHVFGGSHPYAHQALPADVKKAVDRTIDFFNHL